jgi:hypothetical protein
MFLLWAINPSRKSDKAATINMARLKTFAQSTQLPVNGKVRKNINTKVKAILNIVMRLAIFT